MAQRIDFYTLSRVVQDRFVSSTGGAFSPVPICIRHGGTGIAPKFLAASAAGFLFWVAFWFVGFGSLESAASMHGVALLLGHALGFFGLAFGVLYFLTYNLREKSLPYRPGVYLFPACLVDARTRQLVVHPIAELSGVAPQGDGVRVTFKDGAFEFPGAGPVAARIESSKGDFAAAEERADANELVTLDPLYNPRFSSPVGPREPYVERAPVWAKLPWAIALGVAFALAVPSWLVHNHLSDGSMFRKAAAVDSVESYTAYLVRGRREVEQVRDVLLPRAELRVAIAVGTPDALLEYAAKHPASKIKTEVDQATRAAMLNALGKAIQKGGLAPLQEFKKTYPTHGVEPELKAAIHQVYVRELAAYKQRVGAKDKAVFAAVDRLFAWAEAKGPKVEIRFRRKPTKSLVRADDFLQKTPTYNGEISHPTRYFDAKHQSVREAALGKELADKFDQGLSAELFEFGVGPLVDSDAPLTVPTLLITYEPEWSTHTYTNKSPRGSFIGLIFRYELELLIPGDTQPFKWTTSTFRGAALGVLKEGDPPGGEEKVYEKMSEDATAVLKKRFYPVFFSDPPP